MSPKNKNRRNMVHIDLTLIPIKKQVHCIWLSKVIQSHQELQEKTGINLMYIKPILKNKATILKRWKDGMLKNSKNNVSSKETDDDNGVDILLLEWVRRSILNKIVVYQSDIERQAEMLKQIFELPRYRIKPEIWNKINSLTKNRREKRTLPEFVPYNMLTIFKTIGKQLLKHETYLKFSKILASTIKSEIISNEQTDDLILIEKPSEFIVVRDYYDITTDNNNTGYVKNEPPSSLHSYHISTSYLTEETSSDFPKLLALKLDTGASIKEESKENDVKSLNEFPEILIKNEVLENVDQTQRNQYETAFGNESTIKNKTLQLNVNVNVIKAEQEEDYDIKSELDDQEEFIEIIDQRPSKNLSIENEKIQLNINKQELQNLEDPKADNSDDEHESEIDDETQVLEEDIKANDIQGDFEVLKYKADKCFKTELNLNNKATEIFLKPTKEVNMTLNSKRKEESQGSHNVDDNDDVGADNNYSDSDSEIEVEVVYEVEDSNEDIQNELQQIINNYRNEADIRTDRDMNINGPNPSDVEHEEEETITVLEIMSEDDTDCVDEPNVIFRTKKIHKRKKNTTNINANDKLSDNSYTTDDDNNSNIEKRKRLETISDTEEFFDTNLPSTSLLAGVNLQSSSSLSPTKEPLRLCLPSLDPQHEITLENDVDAVKYLQHIKNYFLSQNNEVAVKLILNLQMAFINLK